MFTPSALATFSKTRKPASRFPSSKELNEGDIIHFRKNFRLEFEAITDTRIVAFHVALSCPHTTTIS